MECRLAHSSKEWSCQIKIRWEYEADNVKRREEVEEVEFGPLLTDKAKVEPMLRRAQAAVLNPDEKPSIFVAMSDEDMSKRAETRSKKTLPFSRNVVCMELAGPDLADLSFVDLPGTLFERVSTYTRVLFTPAFRHRSERGRQDRPAR